MCVEYMDIYANILEENTAQLFDVAIDDGMVFTVHLCLYCGGGGNRTTPPFFLIDSEELTFPKFQHVIHTPPLGKSDHDVLINRCNGEIFCLFDFAGLPPFSQMFRGLIVGGGGGGGGGEICVIYEIPFGGGGGGGGGVANHQWALVSQIVQHTPLSFFHRYPMLLPPAANTVIVYGTGKREHHEKFGFFYYFVYDDNRLVVAEAMGTPFLLYVKPKRVINDVAKSLLFADPFFFDDAAAVARPLKGICVKDCCHFGPINI